MSISLITVCHRSRQKIAAYVSSFLAHHTADAERTQYQFVFVENSGDTDFQSAIQPLKDSGFDVIVLYTANDGFGRGCNAGAQLATGDILVFVNPDIRFLNNLAPLLAKPAQQYWGTVRQITPRGRMYSIDLLPEYKGIFFDLFRHHLTNRFTNLFSGKIYVVGSFLIISKNLFKKSGGFNSEFFLYYEEAELARRLQVLIGPPLIELRVSVCHEGFGSHKSQDEIFRHEANGFLTYCKVTNQPKLLLSRLTALKLVGIFLKSSAKRFKLLTIASKVNGLDKFTDRNI